jgi:hypothetical protein
MICTVSIKTNNIIVMIELLILIDTNCFENNNQTSCFDQTKKHIGLMVSFRLKQAKQTEQHELIEIF